MLLGLPNCDGCAAGSNNWVIAGRAHSQRKAAALERYAPAADRAEYLVHGGPEGNGAPSFHAAGVTLPGMPFVIAGHNEHVAWGFTALYADVQDLYVEKLDGKGNYQDNDTEWKPLQVDHEVIKVRGGRDVMVDVQLTPHGPLLNPDLQEREAAHRAEVDALRSIAEWAAALSDECRIQLD